MIKEKTLIYEVERNVSVSINLDEILQDLIAEKKVLMVV